jgi:hypothetical protein
MTTKPQRGAGLLAGAGATDRGRSLTVRPDDDHGRIAGGFEPAKSAAHPKAPRRLAHGIDRTVNDMKAKTKCLTFNVKN